MPLLNKWVTQKEPLQMNAIEITNTNRRKGKVSIPNLYHTVFSCFLLTGKLGEILELHSGLAHSGEEGRKITNCKGFYSAQ